MKEKNSNTWKFNYESVNELVKRLASLINPLNTFTYKESREILKISEDSNNMQLKFISI